MQRFVPFVILLGFIQIEANAQLSTGGRPLATGMNGKDRIPVYEMPSLPASARLNTGTNELPGRFKTYTFAYAFETDVDPRTTGAWLKTKGKYDIWRLAVRSRGALSIGLIFKEFYLAGGVRVFLYNEDRSVVRGAYTCLNNKAWKSLAVSHIPGDEVILQLEVPKELERHFGTLKLGSVAHAYAPVFLNDQVKDGRFGLADSCNIDVKCISELAWRQVRRSVCRVIIDNVQLCSGSLVNNVRNDTTPYIYMAEHCFEGSYRPEDAIFYFNYESPECGGNDGTTKYSISGSTQLAGGDSIDFALLELSKIPPDSFNVYYAGWYRGTDAPDSTVCIHHPRGDVKKITFDYDPPETSYHTANYFPEYVLYSHWRILAWDLGTTQPGSSGSPLFDNHQRIIGSLTGGKATCADNVNDYFTKFSYAWDYNEEDYKQLRHWLDPDSTGALFVAGLEPGDWDGTAPVEEQTLRVYPNPVSGTARIVLPGPARNDVTLRLINMTGKQVMIRRIDGGSQIRIDMSGFPQGIYLVSAHYDGRTARALIAKQ